MERMRAQGGGFPGWGEAWRTGMLVGGLLLGTSSLCYGRGPEPPTRLPLSAYGYQPPPNNSVASQVIGLSSVHFIDEGHLLLTFNVRTLMKRLPECPPEDFDRTVEAVVVDLGTGKAMAHTRWRIHDVGQYLWELGGGRFLLRLRNTLVTIEPLAAGEKREAFAEQPFLKVDRQVAAVLVSADKELVTLETVEAPKRSPTGEAIPQTGLQPTQLNFYRLLEPETPGERVRLQSAGVAVARGSVQLSLTSAGFLEVLQESPARWLFDFDIYGGAYKELSPFDTTCRPRPVFVSASEFVAFGCRGADDRLSLGGFNLSGEQMWQQDFREPHAFPNFAFASKAGRFALSRNLVSPGAGITVEFAPSAFTAQEIRVYQMYSGKQLLTVQATPVQRAGGNYDLSPEGTRLAVLQEDAVVLYRLPPPTKADEAGLKAARALVPAKVTVPVLLAGHGRPADAPPAKQQTARQSMAATSPAMVAVQAPAAEKPEGAAMGDGGDGTGEPRKAPTLYTLPNDKPAAKPQ